ncbi:hypothetical protein V757_04700 [Pelistega indica]|uniref:Uncharacterized protein n=1 Tax=Pelistega indica TaxID=1414851 RepID=V8G7F1_9BURK|nr:hypothetical protein V757_04700 [Pelistega indica]
MYSPDAYVDSFLIGLKIKKPARQNPITDCQHTVSLRVNYQSITKVDTFGVQVL